MNSGMVFYVKFFIVFSMRFCIDFGIPLGVRNLDFAIPSMRKRGFDWQSNKCLYGFVSGKATNVCKIQN